MKLRSEIAIVIVTHNLQQAYRVADRVAFMYLGDLVEYGDADQVFHSPKAKRTQDYVTVGSVEPMGLPRRASHPAR